MDEKTSEWVQLWMTKARNDLRNATLVEESENGPLDTGVYHCEQAAEKAIKGFLAFKKQPLKKTHDLEDLVADAVSLDQAFEIVSRDATFVMPYATQFRYPSDDETIEPSRTEFDEALAAARRIYDFVLSKLPSETHPV